MNKNVDYDNDNKRRQKWFTFTHVGKETTFITKFFNPLKTKRICFI
jgi:hypothetical protein